QQVRERPEDRVAATVSLPLVDRLEVVDVDGEQRERVAARHRGGEIALEELLEAAMVRESGQRIRDELGLQPLADLRVVDREGCELGEPLRELELLDREVVAPAE